MTRIVRAGALLAALGVAMFALAAPAGAQSVPSYTGVLIAVTSNNIVCGTTITATGTGWEPGIPVSLTVQSTPVSLPPVTPDSTGSITVEFASPAEPGSHTLTAVQVVDGVTTTRVTEFTCSDAAGGTATPVTPAGALPFTGSDSAPIAQIGIALLAVGALVVLVVRKRGTNNA